MDNDRNLGVTEARFGLTLLICLSVAIGYVVLLRLGSPVESTIEVRSDVAPHRSGLRDEGDDQPRVLPIESTDETAMRTSPRTNRPAPAHREDITAPSANPVFPAGSTDSQRR